MYKTSMSTRSTALKAYFVFVSIALFVVILK